MKDFDKPMIKINGWDVGLVKLATAAVVLFIITIWSGAMGWVQSVNPWYFLIAAVIFGARPFYKYKELMYTTIKWLKKHSIPYDLLFWGKNKHIQVQKYFEELEFMIEDNHLIANKVAKLGYKVYLMDNKYNRYKLNKNVVRITKLSEVEEQWK